MDCAPPRGETLWWLAYTNYVCGILALVPALGWALGLIGIPFGLVDGLLARRALARMRAGLTDRSGQLVMTEAADLARLGFWLSFVGTVFWGVFLLLAFL
jgi:hypothetical protein